jgi:phosphoribosylformylglycinamidine synthase
MEYLTLLGESAYTPSQARKIQNLINKSGAVKVDEVSAVYVHYAHLKDASLDTAKVCTSFTM